MQKLDTAPHDPTEILESEVFLDHCRDVAASVLRLAEGTSSEATISFQFESGFRGLLKDSLGIEPEVVREETLPSWPGRVDSRMAGLVIEFKTPRAVRLPARFQEAMAQLEGYLLQRAQLDGREWAGALVTGTEVMIGFALGDKVHWQARQPLSGNAILELARIVVAGQQVALTGENLARQLTGHSSACTELIAALFDSIHRNASERARMLHEEWMELFKLSHDDTSKQRDLEDRAVALARAVGVDEIEDAPTEYLALFSIHTAYAMLVKLVAARVLSASAGGSEAGLASLAGLDSRGLRHALVRIDEGSSFAARGYVNLVESDFFSWPLEPTVWTSRLAKATRRVLLELSKFEAPRNSVFHQNVVGDLFKTLYMAMVPSEVRHSFGEYYTPSWLARDTIERALAKHPLDGTNAWRLLDPCCGSGTFLTEAMRKILEENEGTPKSELRKQLLSRLTGFDLNPLAVLAARVNFFVALSAVHDQDEDTVIPIYLGDATRAPKQHQVGGVPSATMQVATRRGGLRATVPLSVLRNREAFARGMTDVVPLVRAAATDSVAAALTSFTPQSDAVPEVLDEYKQFAERLVELERAEWDGIWAKILTNFLLTANLESFDVIVGNPPWVDWKNLPANYRSDLVSSGVARHIFSNDTVTGGINLNVCALIANTAASSWLKSDGVLSFLMPKPILVQQTYEGFRRFEVSDTERLYLQEVVDWTDAGKPFYPVAQSFCTFVYSRHVVDYRATGVPISKATLQGRRTSLVRDSRASLDKVLDVINFKRGLLIAPDPEKTYFTEIPEGLSPSVVSRLAGSSSYRGREGIEFYPQELMLFRFVEGSLRNGPQGQIGRFANVQMGRSKYRVPAFERDLEVRFVRPLVKGPQVKEFHLATTEFYALFPYDPSYNSGRSPLPLPDIAASAPLTAAFLVENREYFEAQTDYNARIIGSRYDSEFYALARVGAYSHAERSVVFRDNSFWGAVVVESVSTPWNEAVRPVFQNHAVSISEGPSGSLSRTEAHYLAGFLNSTLVRNFILASSDSRTFKIRLPVQVPNFDPIEPAHLALADCSRSAHLLAGQGQVPTGELREELDRLVLSII